jgi:hypothetical protein
MRARKAALCGTNREATTLARVLNPRAASQELRSRPQKKQMVSASTPSKKAGSSSALPAGCSSKAEGRAHE